MGSEGESDNVPEGKIISKEALIVELSTSNLIKRFAHVLATASFNLEEAYGRIVEMGLSDEMSADPQTAVGTLAEIHVGLVLRRFREGNKGIVLNPVDPISPESENYRFERVKGGWIVTDKNTHTNAAQLDLLCKAEDIILLAEVKSTKTTASKGATKQRGTFNEALTNEFINNKFRPLQEYFPRTEFGYLVVGVRKVPRDPHLAEELVKRRENGALTVLLPFTPDELKYHVEAINARNANLLPPKHQDDI